MMLNKHKIVSLLLLSSIFMVSCENVVDNRIPIKQPVCGKFEGAEALRGKVDIYSPYFPKLNFYTDSPTKTLVKLDKFRTYQQTSEYSCAAASSLMVLDYFEINDISENELIKEMDIRSYDNPREDGSYGATTDSIINVFKNRGFKVESSFDTRNELGYSFENTKKFSEYVIEKLKSNSPIIVESVEWGGHWMVIIGYDTMGNELDVFNHVIILADPYDTSSHNQNGYIVVNAERFVSTWFDYNVMPRDQSVQQYVTVSR